jgi:transcription elongation factor Elf1
MGVSREIVCTACGQDAFVRCEPVYEGFKKTGEVFVCVSCGHRYENEADLPVKATPDASLFTDADRPQRIDVFAGDEKGHNCRHCRHYVVNPFVQRCSRHNRPVEATDCCNDFDPPDTSD